MPQTITIIDDSLKSGLTLSHNPVIKFSSSDIVSSVLDTKSNSFVAFEKITLRDSKNISEEVIHSDFAKMLQESGTGKAVILIDNPVFTIVPDELYNEHDKNKYLLFTHSFQKNENIATDKLTKFNSQNVYWLPFHIKEFIDKHFFIYETKHSASVFLNFCLLRNRDQSAVYIYAGRKILYIVALKDEGLVLCNAYEYITKEDFVFLIMNVFLKLQFNQQETPLFIMGDLDNLSEFKTMVSKYIAKVEYLDRPAEYNYCKGIDDMPSYFSNILFTTFLCV